MSRTISVRLLFIILLFALTRAAASSHPLGNFTINHLVEVRVATHELHVRYIVDRAEIPTFQLMRASSRDASWTRSQLRAWADAQAPLVSAGLTVLVDGRRVSLQPVHDAARLRPGTGGLPTLYWSGDFEVPIARESHHVVVADRVFDPTRVGWKDIVVAPQTEPTHELQSYPPPLIGSPRAVTSVSFELLPDARVSRITENVEAVDAASSSGISIARTNALSEMFASPNRAPLFLLLTILVAFGLGALHAIEPGHGKALLAVTLVGSRATIKQAAILAASLTFAHTIGVLLLGVVLFFAADFVAESIYTWITLLSGIAVAVIGARNLARYLQARGLYMHTGVHLHSHNAYDHHHGDGAQSHSHVIPGSKPIDFRAAIIAATSGGVAPCPAAIVVMLAALRLHQIGYGVTLIVIFSLGLAFVLTAFGIAIVHGSAWIGRSPRFERLVEFGPLVSAMLISLVGALMVAQGFIAEGIHAPVSLVAGITVLAIAGYALAPHHVHTQRLGES